MDGIREEFDKIKAEYKGCFPNPYINLNFDSFTVGHESRDEEIKKLTEDFDELKDINKEMHLNFKAYRDEINKLKIENKHLSESLNESYKHYR